MIRLLTGISMVFFAAVAQAETIYARVEGMTCASCAQAIEAKLLTHCAVQSVKVDVAKDQVIVVEKPAKHLSDMKFDKLIREAGYSAKSITRRPL